MLWWVSRGKANAEVATALYISESTVRKHLQSAYRKLGVVNRTAAVATVERDRWLAKDSRNSP